MAERGKQDDTLHSFELYSAARQNIARLEREMAREDEEATAAEQLSTFLAVRGADERQVGFCRQAAAELRYTVITQVNLHTQIIVRS